MSNCHSSQAEYSDHDFTGGAFCNDCGEVDAPGVKALNDQVKMLEAKVTELVERNRKLANQIVGYGDRMQQTIAGIVKTAKVEALRAFADEIGDFSSDHIARHIEDMAIRRADNLEAS